MQYLLQRRYRSSFPHVHVPSDGCQPQTVGLTWENTWHQEQLVPWVRLQVAGIFPQAEIAKLWWVEPQPTPHQQHGLDDLHLLLFTPVAGHFAVLVCVVWSNVDPNKHALLAGFFASPVTKQNVVNWLRIEEECRTMTCTFSLGGVQADDEILQIHVDGLRLDVELRREESRNPRRTVDACQECSSEPLDAGDGASLTQANIDLSFRDLSADLDTILRVLRRSYSAMPPGQSFTVQVVSGDGFVVRDTLAWCDWDSIIDERKFRQWLELLLSPSLRGPIRGFLGRVRLVPDSPLLIVARQGQPRQIPYLVKYRPEGLSTLMQIVLVTTVKPVTDFVAEFDRQSYLAWAGEDCAYEVDGRWVEPSFQVQWIPATVIKIFQSRQRIQELDCGPHMELNAYDPYIQAEEAARRLVPDSSSQNDSDTSAGEDTSCLQLSPRWNEDDGETLQPQGLYHRVSSGARATILLTLPYIQIWCRGTLWRPK